MCVTHKLFNFNDFFTYLVESLNATDGDDMFQDKSPPFVIDLPKRFVEFGNLS